MGFPFRFQFPSSDLEFNYVLERYFWKVKTTLYLVLNFDLNILHFENA